MVFVRFQPRSPSPGDIRPYSVSRAPIVRHFAPKYEVTDVRIERLTVPILKSLSVPDAATTALGTTTYPPTLELHTELSLYI